MKAYTTIQYSDRESALALNLNRVSDRVLAFRMLSEFLDWLARRDPSEVDPEHDYFRISPCVDAQD